MSWEKVAACEEVEEGESGNHITSEDTLATVPWNLELLESYEL